MLHKIFVLARRDYLATVLTKSFVLSLLLPVLIPLGLGLFAGGVSIVTETGRAKRIAIMDHTGLGIGADIVQRSQAVRERKADYRTPGALRTARLILETAHRPDREAVAARVRRGQLFGLVEIESINQVVLYSASGTAGLSFMELNEAVNRGLRRAKLKQSGLDEVRFAEVLAPVLLEVKSLNVQQASLGQNMVKSMLIPAGLLVMMVVIVTTASSGMLGGVAEDKKERVFEMMLASATPLEIVAGKVLGAVAISVTGAMVWIGYAAAALSTTGALKLAPLAILPWFFVYLICQLTMSSAAGAAIGAATATPKEAQHFSVVLLLPTLLPLFVVAPLLDQPNGPFAVALSFFPPFAPMVMILRQAMADGVPAWQPWVALGGILLWTVFITWVASRVFRMGLLMQGTRPRLADLARWVVRG